MKSDIRKGKMRLWLGAMALVALSMAGPVWGADLVLDSGATLNVPPAITYDNEYIGVAGAGTLNQTGATNTINNYLYLGFFSGGNGTYNLSGGSLAAPNEEVGVYGTGAFKQSGGTNTITEYLSLGKKSGSSGTYELSGSGILSAFGINIGENGTGTFIQTGGTCSFKNFLDLGRYSGSNGAYKLSDTGSLVTSYQFIGLNGAGIFKQSGGNNTVSDNLSLGYYSGSTGTYELSGSGILSAPNQYIGYSGTAIFTQSGGTNTVADTLTIAAYAGSSGIYNLQGGALSAGTINLNSGGIFNQSGGNLHFTTFNQQGGDVQGSLENRGTFNYLNGDFQGRIINYGTMNLPAAFSFGDGLANYTTLDLIAGRVLTLNGQGLDNRDTLTLAGGTLSGNGPLVNNAYLQGYGTIDGTGGFTNFGFVTQSGGTLTLNNSGANANHGNWDLASGNLLSLGSGATLNNQGTLNLNSAIITGAGTLNNIYGGTITGRGTISSSFENNGGTLMVEDGTTLITKDFSNSGVIKLTSDTASLTGGAISNTGNIRGLGVVGNNITNAGTIEAKGGDLTLSGAVANNTGGLMTASTGNTLLLSAGLNVNAGVINLTGGTFDNNNHALSNTNQISGYGTFRTGGLDNTGTMTLSGGTTTVNGDVTNQASGNLNIAYNPAIFTGNVLNSGTVKVTDTTVTWAGTFTNSGAYLSDPATTYARDMIIDAEGYFQGGAGDRWIIGNDFINRSAMNASWNTALASLAFTSGGDNRHELYLPGQDRGANWTGYNQNFAWGSLDLTGQILSLFDGNGDAGGALYLGAILGVLLSDSMVTNIIGNGFDIYYNAALGENAYLDGKIYNLTDGGLLAPAVPLPASAWLFLSGLVGLGLLGRRKNRRSQKS